MRRVIIQCEECEDQYVIPASMSEGEWANLANGWFILHENPRENSYKEDAHFCSVECLKKFFGMSVHPVTTEEPQSKMRRFLLVDGETADEFEAIKFSSGHVSVDFDGKHFPMHFSSWDDLKDKNPGSGVTWIDQEVSDAN